MFSDVGVWKIRFFNVLYDWIVSEYVMNGARRMDFADSKLLVWYLYFMVRTELKDNAVQAGAE